MHLVIPPSFSVTFSAHLSPNLIVLGGGGLWEGQEGDGRCCLDPWKRVARHAAERYPPPRRLLCCAQLLTTDESNLEI